MIESEHIIKALFITIPIAVVVGIGAGLIRKRITPAMIERHGAKWCLAKNSIYAIGISLFGGLAYYCMEVIEQPGFGYLYLIMSVMNGVCLIRATRRERVIPEAAHRNQGLPRRMSPH